MTDRLAGRGKHVYALVPALAFALALPAFLMGMFLKDLDAAWIFFVFWEAMAFMYVGPVVVAINHLVPVKERATASASYLLVQHIIGAGFGTFILGLVSDLLAAEYGKEALRYSILFCLPAYIVAGILLCVAAKFIGRDWHEK